MIYGHENLCTALFGVIGNTIVVEIDPGLFVPKKALPIRLRIQGRIKTVAEDKHQGVTVTGLGAGLKGRPVCRPVTRDVQTR